MADPIFHPALVAHTTKRDSFRLAALISHVAEGEPEVASLVVITLAFLGACAESGVEPDDVLDQVVEAIERGELQLSEDELNEIELPYTRSH